MNILFVILGILAALILWAIVAYNGFIRLRNRVDEGWADIDVQLKRRYDLIPNLIETVKGYAQHESEVLENVVAARSRATQTTIDPSNMTHAQMQQAANAQQGLSSALSRLLAIAENYPDLKANENFLELQRELTDTEDKIQAARRFYNGLVRDFNTASQVFPGSIIAGAFNFTQREFFELDEASEEKEPVKVSF